MLRCRLSFALMAATLLLLTAWSSPACAIGIRHGHRDEKREIEDMEMQWRSAQLSSDMSTMDRLLSDDYVGIGMNGIVTTKAQQLDRIRKRTLALTRIDLSEVKIKLLGSVAIVTCLAQIEGTNDGNSMSGEYRYTRVYQKLPFGVWKITNFEATRIPQDGRRRNGQVDSLTPLPPKANFVSASAASGTVH